MQRNVDHTLRLPSIAVHDGAAAHWAGFTDRACHTLERTATRQIERLVALAEKPSQGWSRADLALERQAVAILGQILNLENKMKTAPAEKPALSLGNL